MLILLRPAQSATSTLSHACRCRFQPAVTLLASRAGQQGCITRSCQARVHAALTAPVEGTDTLPTSSCHGKTHTASAGSDSTARPWPDQQGRTYMMGWRFGDLAGQKQARRSSAQTMPLHASALVGGQQPLRLIEHTSNKASEHNQPRR